MTNKSRNLAIILSTNALLLSPDHLVHNSRIALYDLDYLSADIFLHIIRHGCTMVSRPVQLHGHLHCLQQGALVDARQHKACLVQRLRPLGTGSDAHRRKRMTYGSKKGAFLRQSARIRNHCERIQLQMVIIMKSPRVMTDHTTIQLKTGFFQLVSAAELKMSFPAYLNVFSKVTTQTSLKLLEAYPLAADMLAAPKDDLVETIRSTARFGEKYALARYDAICTAAQDAAVFGRAIPSNAVRIRLYIKAYREYQEHLDSILEELHKAVDKLQGDPVYDRICLLQSLRGAGFLSSVVLIAEMGSFDLFSSPKKLYAYFGMDPGVNDSGKFHGDRVHMSKRGSSLARRILHMVAVNNLKVDKSTKTPVNPVIYDYYTRKCAGRKKMVAVGAVMHKICNIIFAMLRDNKPFELITPEEHCERYAAEHPESVNSAA